ncbi:cell division protein FtsQ/DivIB [Streptomyces natalensis]|uniref:Cell division protein FtsQ n=1 Tax=Streptomyces natalensis ATCC 27448 TaxID=1240678 RepID=A0A0D7CQX0_9ACTN|nr:FtsQ-type POTRA domain-containing protein [Streptomyces natalensis]KIZ18245.1 cell division protein FtsQ [Streptomyces natalensis ATCC 27448]
MAGSRTARRGDEKRPTGPPPASAPRTWRFARLGAPFDTPRRRLALALVLVLGLGGFATWALYGSDWLRLRHVKATGTTVLTPDEVLAAARAPINAPLASVDTDELARRIRDRLPRVKNVAVVRSWPHTIGLKVTERTPQLALRSGGNYREVDRDGVSFATVRTLPRGVPLLEMAVSDSPSLSRFGTDRLRHAAADAVAALPGAVRKDVRTVRVASYDSLTLELTRSRTVVWGSREQGAEKARVLTALLKAAGEARHFDVSVPSAPAVSGS